MTPDQWQSVNEIFEEATSIAPDRRDAFLSGRCAGRDDIRKEVESLLRFRRDEDSLFGNMPARQIASVPSADFADWAGRRLGRYRLKQLLSTGGMGVVFLAEQETPRRDVAIKLLQRGLHLAGARRRFEYETQILGRLKHPCIAEIYEAGRAALTPAPENGPAAPLHFFAMEYVEGGQTLTAFADAHKLKLEDKLRLFTRICDGIHHGHQKGVIHRDLKPSNILVTMEQRAADMPMPLPKIIDFGVAKCTDGDIAVTTMQTSAGDLLGTLQYMSPEQCGADSLAIDTRADVYALGVILYELLTKHVPYDVSNLTIQAAVHIITESMPRPPSDFNHELRGDLEVIINKALEKDRDKRYGSAAAMADDIQRHLNKEPISARSPTRWERSIRWLIRHPRWFSVAGSLTISMLIIGFTALSIWFANRMPDRVELTYRGNAIDWKTTFPVDIGDRAVLYARSGVTLRQWKSAGSGIRFFNRMDRPIEWGGGSVMVIGCNELSEEPALRNKIGVYEFDNLTVPWKTIEFKSEFLEGMEDHDWPRPESELDRTYSASDFYLMRAWDVNVFDDEEYPGDEIIAYFQNTPGSQGLLLISDLRGEPLFRVWQDGGIHDVFWISDDHTLICAALRADRDDRGFGLDMNGANPNVLFGINPKPKEYNASWIIPYQPDPKQRPRYLQDRWQGRQYPPKWYKAVCPAWISSPEIATTSFQPSYRVDDDRPDHAILTISFEKIPESTRSEYQLSVSLNAQGEIIDQLMPGNRTRSIHDKTPSLPTVDDISLVEWKGVTFPCEEYGNQSIIEVSICRSGPVFVTRLDSCVITRCKSPHG